MSKHIITHAAIMRRVKDSGIDISHENVRYYRTRRDVPKQRKKQSKYAAAIEAAERELLEQLKKQINGEIKTTMGRRPATTAADSL